MKKKIKKSSVLKYKVLKKEQGDRVKGIKLLIEQKRLAKKILFIIPIKWNKKRLVLWNPDNSIKIKNTEYKKGDWIILKEDFDSFNSKKIRIKHICKNKKLLTILK